MTHDGSSERPEDEDFMSDEEFVQELQDGLDRGWLGLSGRGISDKDMKLVWTIPSVKRLLLDDNHLTDRWLDECPGPTDVVVLTLANVPITDAGLKKVPYYFPDLVVLHLGGTETTLDGILAHLPACRNLSVITHGGIEPTDINVARLNADFPYHAVPCGSRFFSEDP